MHVNKILLILLSACTLNSFAVSGSSPATMSTPSRAHTAGVSQQNKSLDHSPVTTLNTISTGVILASTERGGLFLYRNQRWTSLGNSPDGQQIYRTAVLDGVIYVLTASNILYQVNPSAKKWQLLPITKNLKIWDIAATGDLVYLAGSNGDNYLLQKGKLKKLPSLEIKSLYAVSEHEVYAGDASGQLYRFTGKLLDKGWKKEASLDGYNKPIWSINKSPVEGIIAGTDNGNVVKYDKDTNSLQPIGNPILSQFDNSKVWYLQADSENIYTVTDNGSLFVYHDGYWKKHAINIANETDCKIWSIYISGKTLYIGTESGVVLAYNLVTDKISIL
ncbi:hypothetical protein [Aquella oligotrophica]|uniref:Uncharacterized protein n=1 Tax=Aquella oligotrophica TaxID=2067065 RepID=A0A2I7N704_9NEIS|nr:hypothetical protein [Aquella oligotrophica]AUR52256.1 hypothetical protein CUN60_08100 [Aquella oligotrophica]